MKLLREYIRGLLEAGELGRKVFSDRAPDGPHYGTERDTETEASLWVALRGHIGGRGGHLFNQEKIDLVSQLANDPQYNDVFTLYAGGDAYRGMSVASYWLDERVPGWEDYAKSTKWSEVIPADFEFKPHNSGVASWTHSEERGKLFGRDNSAGDYGVVLIADSQTNNFLDMSELYRFDGLDEWHWEEEIIGLGPIRVKGIRVRKHPRMFRSRK